jgi:hypothetical protein
MRATRVPSVAAIAVAAALLLAACGDEGRRGESATPEGAADISRAIRERLRAGDVEGASGLYARLVERHEGRAVTESGRALPRSATAGAVFDDALDAARARIEGARPDRAAADRALAVARRLLADTEDAESEGRLERAERWVRRETAEDLASAWPKHEGPRVVVHAEDFALAETVFLSVLARWAREGEAQGLEVLLVPVIAGNVREGIRRVPAESPAAERRHALARIEGTMVRAAPTSPTLAEAGAALGVEEGDAAILVLDRSGRVAGRLSGRTPDPRVLEVVVQRVGSR